MKRIVFVAENYNASSWYRGHVPGAELEKRGYDVSLIVGRNRMACEDADIIVFERTSSTPITSDLRHFKQLGKHIVYDIDDNFWNISPSNPAYEYLANNEALENTALSLRTADVVTVATEPLRDAFRKFNRDIRVIPNYLPEEHWNFEPDDDGVLTIGWAGSPTHWEDLKVVSGAIGRILEEFPEVELAVAGMPSYPFPEHPRMKKLEPVGTEEYPTLIAKFDIGLAPLTGDYFNACKSDLKFLEYGALGIPCVASRVPAYERSIVSGVNGFLARNAKDWLKHLRQLIADKAIREEIGAAARDYAGSRFIGGNIELWEQALRLRVE